MVYISTFLPHEWLFLKCKLAIIHGGVGTTLTALRSGIIPIIIYAGGDQVTEI